MYKIAKALFKEYNEATQNNPLRWEICYLDKETNTLIPQAAKMKCKDFFNDLVAAYRGEFFNIYNFDNKSVKLAEDGVYFRLSYVKDFEQMKVSLDALCNPEHPPVLSKYPYGKEKALLFIPRWYFNNTYYISLLSHIVRMSNYDKALTSWEDYKTLTRAKEPGLFSEHLLNWKWTLPEHLKEYWFFCGFNHNSSKKGPYYSSLIHNNGFKNWILYGYK